MKPLRVLKRLLGEKPTEESGRHERYGSATPQARRPQAPPLREHDTIVARRVAVRGSIHAAGEADVTVECLHSWNKKRLEVPIDVEGSVHSTGEHDSTVNETDGIEPDVIPEPAKTPHSFTDGMESSLSLRGETFHIDTLIIVESDQPRRLKALCEEYGAVYEKLRLRGAVHETGTIDVHIEDCYVVE